VKEVKSFVIDRAKWGVGKNGGSLLNPDTGLMCCLGHYMRALGATKRSMRWVGLPGRTLLGGLPEWLTDIGVNTSVDRLVKSNDSCDISQKEREKRVKEGFAAQGIKVSFKGRLPRKLVSK
jgi:hypothetical protein